MKTFLQLAILLAGWFNVSSAFITTKSSSCTPVGRLLPANSIPRQPSLFSTLNGIETTTENGMADGQEMIEATRVLVEEKDDFTLESLENFFPLMVYWTKMTTTTTTAAEHGAIQVERLLSRLEKELLTGTKAPPRPPYMYYTLAIDAWAKAGYPEKAERIVRQMQHLANNSTSLNKSFAPTRATYNALMKAYTRQGDMDRALELFHIMEQSAELDPTVVDLNVLLAGYAKQGNARQAEELLASTIKNNSNVVPDIYTYNTLLDAWSRSNESRRGLRAQEILSTLVKESEYGNVNLTPDEVTFSAALTALVRGGGTLDQIEELWSEAQRRGFGSDPYLSSILLDAYASAAQEEGAAEKAETMLKSLEEMDSATTLSYNTVLKAWKGRRNEEALRRAETIFERMKLFDMTDSFSYCTMIALYANVGNKMHARKADGLLQDMYTANMIPNVATLNAVMNAWTKCGEMKRADLILSSMEEEYYNGTTGRNAPNVVSFTTLMDGWARSGHERALERTQDTFERMQSMYRSGNEKARPNLVSYVILIGSIARSNQPWSAEKAQKKLFEMYDEYKSGVVDAPPNARLVTSVIDSWQKSGQSNAGERAEDLLEWLLSIYKENGDKSLQPNEYTFNAVISAWARTRKYGKAARAKAILCQMKELHKSGTIQASPNTHCYTAVINSCAYCEQDSLEKRQALRVAIETYKELLKEVPEGANQVTFSTLVTALRKLLPPDDTRDAAVGSIFKKCADEGHVSDLVLRQVQASVSLDQLQKLVGTESIAIEGGVTIEQIPSKWRRNVKPGHKRSPVTVSTS